MRNNQTLVDNFTFDNLTFDKSQLAKVRGMWKEVEALKKKFQDTLLDNTITHPDGREMAQELCDYLEEVLISSSIAKYQTDEEIAVELREEKSEAEHSRYVDAFFNANKL